jgi:catechol 2,3-dioxygenase-like lactoylglutathione lyase family enzyme
VALGAADVERVADFYREVFGLPEVMRHFEDSGRLRSIWLALAPGASARLSSSAERPDPGAPRASPPLLMIERTEAPLRAASNAELAVGAGPFLLAFAVAPQDLAALEAAAERRGAAVEARTAFSSYFRDPEGNRVALSHYPEARSPEPRPRVGG